MNRSPFGARTVLAIIAVSLCLLSFPLAAHGSSASDSAREQAKEILTDKRYGSADKKPLSKDVDRLNDWLGGKKNGAPTRSDEQVDKQFSEPSPVTAPPALGGLSAVGQIMLYALLALIVGGIGYLIYRAVRNSGQKKQHKKRAEEIDELDIDWTDEEKVLEYITDAELLERMSEQAEQAGHLDLALRYRFRSGLLRLNDINAISFHPSVTNAQWQLVINNDAFNNLTRDFNDVTYGHRQCDPSVLTRSRSEWARLMSEEKSSSESRAS